jgi:hypothetical protein
MAKATVHLPVVGLGNTMRTDAWWAGPLATFIVFSSFVLYATFRVFENKYYEVGAYLSPFYSPLIQTHGWGIPFLSPAMLILPGPLSFRMTCYYYRKAYYRAFAMDPPACAVGERAPHRYNGETKLLVIQNLHRFALYIALAFILILGWDVVKSVIDWPDGIHMGLGTVIMAVNVFLISGYTLGCHAFRHLVGGSVDSYSEAPLGKLRYDLWRAVTKLNVNHALWAWLSLFSVALTDLYIRMISAGAFHDIRFF